MYVSKSVEATKTYEQKIDRVYKTYHFSKARFIENVESVWAWTEGEEFDGLYRILKKTLEGKSRMWERKYRNAGITFDEFHSVMLAKAWELSLSYNPQDTDFLYYEILLPSLHNAVIDFLRREKRYRRCNVSNGQDVDSVMPDIADSVVDRLTVQQLLQDNVLTVEERILLCAMYDSDGRIGTVYRQLGYSRMQYRRMIQKIRRKVTDYDVR